MTPIKDGTSLATLSILKNFAISPENLQTVKQV